MKKFLVMLAILAIAIAGVSAEARWTGTTLDTNSKAEVQVSLDLGGDLGRYYQIGFSEVEVTPATDLATLSLETEIVLDQEQNSGEIQNAANSTYVYYAVQIPSGESVNIGFEIAKNLTADGDDEGIVWTASANSKTATAGESEGKAVITTVQGNGELQVDSFPVTVSTSGLRSHEYVAKKYTGNLVVTVSAS